MIKYQLSQVPQSDVQALREQYLRRLVNPLDGMWLTFAQMAQAYAICHAEDVIGYFLVNADQKLLRFHVQGRHARAAFAHVLADLSISGAVVATCESSYLALCMDHQVSVRVNALMYGLDDTPVPPLALPPRSEFSAIRAAALPHAVDFGCNALGADRTWLEGYYTDLVSRGELFGLWLDGEMIAAGECRPSALQPPYADVGMVVSRAYRGRGIASAVLRQLLIHCTEKALRAICSTARDNLPAQGAIRRAGFVSRDRILEVDFG